MEEKFKERFTIPTRYDSEPFGTIVKFIGENDSYELWIQLSKDEKIADWKKVRYLLEETFKDLLTDSEFINACLGIYNGNENKNGFQLLSWILSRKD
jgi:hypothetical protein